jgi:hypothetical protein
MNHRELASRTSPGDLAVSLPSPPPCRRGSGSESLTGLEREDMQQLDLSTSPDDLSPGNAIRNRVQADPLDPGCLVDVGRLAGVLGTFTQEHQVLERA